MLGKATVGTTGKPEFLSQHPPRHARLSPPPKIPTGRMKAVSGGSWLEYLSIHRSSSRIGPSWKAVCSKESRAERPYCKHATRPLGSTPSCVGVPLPSASRITSLSRQRARMSALPKSSGAQDPGGQHSGAALTQRPQELPEQARNYLSETPWLRNSEWPGRSRHPAACTGSGNKGEEKGRLWTVLGLLDCEPNCRKSKHHETS